MGSTLDAYGIKVPLPAGWEARAMQRDAPPEAVAVPGGVDTAQLRAGDIHRALGGGWPGERTFPVVHMGNFALPPNRGDFGSGAVERMGAENVFVTLFEYGPESVGQAMFDRPLPRRLDARAFSPAALQRRIQGQAGLQVFCTEGGRAFCLFVVLGAQRRADRLLPGVNGVLPQIEVKQR